jgi:hypothetical protein
MIGYLVFDGQMWLCVDGTWRSSIAEATHFTTYSVALRHAQRFGVVYDFFEHKGVDRAVLIVRRGAAIPAARPEAECA